MFPALSSSGVNAVCAPRFDLSCQQILALLASVHDAITVVRTDGKLMYANPAAYRLHGDALGAPLPDEPRLFFQDGQALSFENSPVGQALQGNVVDALVRQTNPGAHDQWFRAHAEPLLDDDGAIQGAVTTSADITALVEHERSLAEALELQELLLHQMPLGLALVERQGDDFVFLLLNRVGRERGVISRKSEVGLHLGDTILPDLKPALWPRLYDALRDKVRADIVLERDEAGRHRYLSVIAMPVRGPQDDWDRLILVTRDVTDQKEAELALRRSEARLRQNAKMEAVARLAGGIAHDFNNLMTTVIGHASMLLATLNLPIAARQGLEDIVTSGEEAAALTRHLLAYSRQQVLAPRVLDLNRAIEGMMRTLRHVAGPQVEIVLDQASSLPTVKLDPAQLQQVLVELVANARDAMPYGGLLSLTTTELELREDPGDGPTEFRPGRYVALCVSDTGSGMDGDVAKRAFEPFFSTKGFGHGAGLGLATVQGIVAQSGGLVTLHSQPDLGTTFRLFFPAVAQPLQPRPWSGMATMPVLPACTGTVLVVEDEATVRNLLHALLTRCGLTVLTAPDGLAALEMVRDRLDTIDLVVSDIVMPHLDGVALIERLHALRPDLKALLITGYADDVDLRAGTLADQVPVLAKPFAPEELLARVRDLLAQRRSPVQQP